MATTNITERFLNQDKRYAEDVVVTVPAVLQQGGGRSNALPVYLQGGDAVTAQVIEAGTLIKKAYLIVDEAFPTGALIQVDIAGTQYFMNGVGDTTGLTVSTEEDVWLMNSQTVTISVTGVTGDITTGKMRVVFDVAHPDLKNGQYAN